MARDARDEPPVPAFSPRLVETSRRPPSPRPRLLLGLLLALVVGVVVWAAIGRVDIVARADGQLVPETRLKIVQPFERGRIAEILVAEGDTVEKGQALVRMDRRLSEAELDELEGQLANAKLTLRRIRAELDGEPLERKPGDDAELFARIEAQYEGHRQAYRDAMAQQRTELAQARKELAAARARKKQLAETLPIVRQSEQALGQLNESGYASRIAMLDKRRARIETQQSLAAQRHRIAALEAKVDNTRQKIQSIQSSYRERLVDERVEVAARVESLRQKLRRRSYRQSLLEVTAPQDGIVKGLATHTEGSVVPSGAVLMRLVPQDEPLIAEVYVSNRDVGVIHPGQTARVKLAAYDFQRYGTLDANVEHVSPDAGGEQAQETQSSKKKDALRYRTRLALERQYLTDGDERLDLRAGMHVTAEIKLGTRTVLEYVFSPIAKAVSEAGTER